jgi:uncharacterized membrane protein
MEIFSGFMVMISFISLFLAVVWLIMPFVVFAIKGKQERTLEILEVMEKRLAEIEARISVLPTPAASDSYRKENMEQEPSGDQGSSLSSSND